MRVEVVEAWAPVPRVFANVLLWTGTAASCAAGVASVAFDVAVDPDTIIRWYAGAACAYALAVWTRFWIEARL